MKYRMIITVVAAMLMSLPNETKAQDRQFVWTYQSGTLPKGMKDLEAWGTYSTGRKYFYNRLDTRLEMEVGLTDRFQGAFYFNASHKMYEPFLDSLGGIADTSVHALFRESSFSVSTEWKYRVLDASTAPVGLGLYAEITVGAEAFEIENKIIIDKRLPHDNFAMNIVNEYEMEYELDGNEVELEKEDEVELDLAYMHMFKPTFGLGLEMRNVNEIEAGAWNFSATFGGPTMFIAGEKHFMILNFMPQWMNLHKTDDAPDNLALVASEKYAFRLLWGFGI